MVDKLPSPQLVTLADFSHQQQYPTSEASWRYGGYAHQPHLSCTVELSKKLLGKDGKPKFFFLRFGLSMDLFLGGQLSTTVITSCRNEALVEI